MLRVWFVYGAIVVLPAGGPVLHSECALLVKAAPKMRTLDGFACLKVQLHLAHRATQAVSAEEAVCARRLVPKAVRFVPRAALWATNRAAMADSVSP